MAEQQSEKVNLEDAMPPLPPAFEQFLGQLKADRVKLMTEDAFKNPEQLRLFVATYLYPRQEKMFRFLAGVALDAYGLASSNTQQLRRMHAFMVGALNDMGAGLDDADMPGVRPDVLDAFQEAFFGLGTLLEKRLPEDAEIQGAYNACAAALSEVIGDLMGDYDDGDDDYDDEDDDDSDDDGGPDDSGSEGSAKASSVESSDSVKADGADADKGEGDGGSAS